MSLDRHETAGIAAKLTLAIVIVVGLALSAGPAYVSAWVPWYRNVLEVALPNYSVSNLGVVTRHGENYIAGEFVSTGDQVIHDRVAAPGAVFDASILVGKPLRLAFFRAYASSISLPICLQGSIPGSWLAITQAGSHPLVYATLPSRNSETTTMSYV